jgi:hypothetical protein
MLPPCSAEEAAQRHYDEHLAADLLLLTDEGRKNDQNARFDRFAKMCVDHDNYMRYERGPCMARTRAYRKAHKVEIDAAKLAVIVARRAYRKGFGSLAALHEAHAQLAKFVKPCKEI